jgi:hypothetical protein
MNTASAARSLARRSRGVAATAWLAARRRWPATRRRRRRRRRRRGSRSAPRPRCARGSGAGPASAPARRRRRAAPPTARGCDPCARARRCRSALGHLADRAVDAEGDLDGVVAVGAERRAGRSRSAPRPAARRAPACPRARRGSAGTRRPTTARAGRPGWRAGTPPAGASSSRPHARARSRTWMRPTSSSSHRISGLPSAWLRRDMSAISGHRRRRGAWTSNVHSHSRRRSPAYAAGHGCSASSREIGSPGSAAVPTPRVWPRSRPRARRTAGEVGLPARRG